MCKSFLPYCFIVWTLHNMCMLCVRRFYIICVALCLCYFSFVLSAFICVLCTFMTYSTSYCCHYKLTDPWNVCMCLLQKKE
jgi:hypothetical protein